MTRHGMLRRSEILRGERDPCRQIPGQRRMKRRLPARRVQGTKYLDRQRHIEKTLGNSRRAAALKLRHDAAHDAMIRMARPSVGPPRDHDIGTQTLQFLRDALADAKDQRSISRIVSKLAVRKAE